MKSLQEVLTTCVSYLQEKGISQPKRQVEYLVCSALNLDRLSLYLNFDKPLTEEEYDRCKERIERRGRGEPIQYIEEKVEFYQGFFQVSPDALIPRPETEILVDKFVSLIAKKDLKNQVLWDVCTGTGCIGIAIKKRFPSLEVVLSDISEKALNLAAHNAKQNGVQIECLQGDLLMPFIGKKAHFFICNPPYIAEKDWADLDSEVRDYEPKVALVGGREGTEFYHRLENLLPDYLHSEALVAFEIGYDQGEKVKKIFDKKPWKNQRIEKDWSGKDRFFFLENE